MPNNTEDIIIPFPPKQSLNKHGKESERKFGKKVMDCGFNMIPSILLRGQQRLGLTPTQLAVLIQLLDYWWTADNPPRPGQKGLASRLGISKRQLQRVLKELEQGGFIEVVHRHHAGHNGRQPNQYKPTGLIKKLKELEPEFAEAKEKARKTKADVEKRGHTLRKQLGIG